MILHILYSQYTTSLALKGGKMMVDHALKTDRLNAIKNDDIIRQAIREGKSFTGVPSIYFDKRGR